MCVQLDDAGSELENTGQFLMGINVMMGFLNSYF